MKGKRKIREYDLVKKMPYNLCQRTIEEMKNINMPFEVTLMDGWMLILSA